MKPLLELCERLAPKNQKLARAVADSSKPWRALLDELQKARIAVEIDWKQEAADAFAQLKRLRGAPPMMKKLKLALDELDTGQFLETLGRALRDGSDVTLASIDLVGDSYGLILVPTSETKKLQSLAKRAGGEIDLFTGSDLRMFTRARQERESRDDARWYREQPHFLRGDEVAHFLFSGNAWALSRHPLKGECKTVKRAATADAATRKRAIKAEMDKLERDGWRRVRRAEYTAAFQRANKR